MTSDSKDKDQSAQHSSHRSRRSRHSSRSHLKVWVLTLALVVTLIFLFVTLVYNSSRIDKLSTSANTAQEELFRKDQEIEALKSTLSQSKTELENFIQGRLPSVMKLETDQVMAINDGFIKNIVFSVVSENGTRVYEYKLVLENLIGETIVPKFRVLVFDQYGVQIGLDQVLRGDELAAGESRSYSSKVEFFMDEQPAYFKVTSLIPSHARQLQSLLLGGDLP